MSWRVWLLMLATLAVFATAWRRCSHRLLVGDFPTVERSSRGLALAMLPHVAALVAPSARVRTRANRGTRQGLSRALRQSQCWACCPRLGGLTAVSVNPAARASARTVSPRAVRVSRSREATPSQRKPAVGWLASASMPYARNAGDSPSAWAIFSTVSRRGTCRRSSSRKTVLPSERWAAVVSRLAP
jgi:hypothetical protein